METVAVLGAGNMGTALAQVIAANGHTVRLWSIEHDVLEQVRDQHLNTKYLDDVRLHERIQPVWELPEAVAGAALTVMSVPSQIVAGLAKDLAPLVRPEQVILNVAKGLQADTHRRMSEVLVGELGDVFARSVGSMGGPAIAIEMARGVPMAVIIGLGDKPSAAHVQQLLQNHHLKVETTTDVCGLELCATLKNVYAIALGMCDGLGYGTNTKAFLATLALGEMCDIVSALGGERQTVFGLAGIGDLLTTGFSPHSRNRTLGEKLGAGGDWQQFLRTKTVEGVTACRSITELIAGKGLDTHVLSTIHDVLFATRPTEGAIGHFFREFAYGD
jgi:glycerol-3-phosphate dehydrogenase (NAD(P)+)